MELVNAKLTAEGLRLMADNLIIGGLPQLPFSRRKELPRLPGVYFVLHGGKVIYIGESISIWKRRGASSAQGNNLEPHVAWLVIREKRVRRLVERALIRRRKPWLNLAGKTSPVICGRCYQVRRHSPKCEMNGFDDPLFDSNS